MSTDTTLRADVAVVGGGLGGIAAALAAADAGARVVLTEADPVIGGQVTSQLVAPLDEHPLVETTGVTASYREFRDRVRRECGGVANPGAGWVSRLCFEPAVGLRVLRAMLEPHIRAGNAVVLTRTWPVACEIRGDRVVAVEMEDANAASLKIVAPVFVDATELGDLLPLAGVPWVIGSEGSAAYGEEAAVPGGPDSSAEQSCTWVAAVRLDPAGQHPIGPPSAGYAALRDSQPFSFDVDGADGGIHRYRFGSEGPTGRPPFWTYRRIRAQGPEIAVLNWPGNDYRGHGLVGAPAQARAGARRLTEAFVHWLRSEAPRDPGSSSARRHGYPELNLCPDAALSDDGLALAPYVRESRRLRIPRPVTAGDLAAAPGAERAAPVADSVGVAWYHADLHARIGHTGSVYAPTAPFQIPLRALIATRPTNLVMAAKNIGATQVAAAAYRVHPAEWAIGEAAGVVAASATRCRTDPAGLASDPAAVRRIQLALLRRGAPLVWSTDLVVGHPAFVAGQLLAAHGGLAGDRASGLATRPDEPADAEDLEALRSAASRLSAAQSAQPIARATSWTDAALGLLDPALGTETCP